MDEKCKNDKLTALNEAKLQRPKRRDSPLPIENARCEQEKSIQAQTCNDEIRALKKALDKASQKLEENGKGDGSSGFALVTSYA